MIPRVEQAMQRAWSRLGPDAIAFCAVSGGLDSMAMLEAAARCLSAGEKRRLVVLHVNHNLRGAESDGDEAFVRAAGKRLGLEVRVHRLEWKGDRPSQALCRERREEFFRSFVRADRGDRIFLAHHLNDQAETILQRLLRGSGVRGLAGMREESGLKVRPLLGVTRAEIEAYARAEGISWREDSSNKSQKYERNWLRLEILPKLEARRPGFAEKLAALAEEAAALQLPNSGIRSFELSEDWSFYHGRDLKNASPGELSGQLRLSRLHTRGLCDLLQKGSGRYTAEGVGFRLSSGILLAEKKPFVASSDWLKGRNSVAVKNLLGEWEIRLQPGEKAGASSEFGLGEKAKKEFQKHRVPVFFRELIPLLVKEGRPKVLLPVAGEARAQIEFTPLGEWWAASKSL